MLIVKTQKKTPAILRNDLSLSPLRHCPRINSFFSFNSFMFFFRSSPGRYFGMLVHSLFEFLASFFPICHHQNLYDMKRGEKERETKREREDVSNGSEKHQKYFIYSSKGKDWGTAKGGKVKQHASLSRLSHKMRKDPGKEKRQKKVIGTMMFKK